MRFCVAGATFRFLAGGGEIAAWVMGGLLAAGCICADAAEKHTRGGVVPSVREIRDPSTGAVWLIVRDPDQPGGPGRMRLTTGEGRGAAAEKDNRGTPMIHAGQKIVVEEHTITVEARLEGVALEAAKAGSALLVRLNIGGRVVRAIALAPGRAFLADLQGGRP